MFDLSAPPEGFVENPFPHYDCLLRETPVLRQPDGSVLICRHADLNASLKTVKPGRHTKRAGCACEDHPTVILGIDEIMHNVDEIILLG